MQKMNYWSDSAFTRYSRKIGTQLGSATAVYKTSKKYMTIKRQNLHSILNHYEISISCQVKWNIFKWNLTARCGQVNIHLSSIQNGLKKGDCFRICKVQETRREWKQTEHTILVYVDAGYLLDENIKYEGCTNPWCQVTQPNTLYCGASYLCVLTVELHVSLPAPRILRRLQQFWKICAPLIDIIKQNRNAQTL
jgi:hypothetical protein